MDGIFSDWDKYLARLKKQKTKIFLIVVTIYFSETSIINVHDIVTTWVTEGTMLSNQVSPIT